MISPAAEVGHSRATDGVIGTAMKSCIHRHPTHPDQRPPRPPKLNIVVLIRSSFAGLRCLLSICAGCLWKQIFMAVQVTLSAAVSDFGGRRYHRFVPICRKNRPLSSIPTVLLTRAITLVPGVIVTEITKKPKIYHRCQRHRRKTVHQCQ